MAAAATAKAMRWLCVLLLAAVTRLAAANPHSRKLQQGNDIPLSATPADLYLDPQGRGHLLMKLPMGYTYTPQYPYSFSAENFNVDPKLDPGNGIPATGNGAQSGTWKVVGDTGAQAVHAIPFTNDLLLFMVRHDNGNGSNFSWELLSPDKTHYSFAAIYNMTSNTFKPFDITEHPFCSGHALLPDGRAIIVGGDNIDFNPPWTLNGIQAIRVFDPQSQTYEVVGQLDRARWYPSVLTLSDGSLLVLGGQQQDGAGGWGADSSPSTTSHPIVSCTSHTGGSKADPAYDNPSYTLINTTDFSQTPALTLTILLQAWPISSYPTPLLLPTGSVLVIAGALMQAMYLTPEGAFADNAVGPLDPLSVPVSYPDYTPITLMPLSPPSYDAQVLIGGGTSEFCANANTPAGATSQLIDVSPGADHTPVVEPLAFPRIMGDLTLLPDGRAFLCNGAQKGIAGGTGPNGASQDIGTTIAEMYDPSKPVGQRWSQVADSGIWRLYHSWAFLTSNATVAVGGSDVTAERRLQIYTPDYLSNGKPRPTISNVPSEVIYQETFSFGYSVTAGLDRVVINRLSSATHAQHFDQRQVVLACSGASGGDISCTGPPNSSVAPPGVYMLFGLYQGVPSVASYVTLPVMLDMATIAPPPTATQTVAG